MVRQREYLQLVHSHNLSSAKHFKQSFRSDLLELSAAAPFSYQ